MEKDQPVSVKDAVHKIQLHLLEGIQNENQLFAAGSFISRSDYEDVVTERSIGKLCGYPLCSNNLPSDRPRKGRYRISVKEHKVYDLQETYMYCSSGCVINSRAFVISLQEERCSILDTAKFDQVMMLFEGLSLSSEEGLGKNGDLGMSDLKIHEKMEAKSGDVSLEEWIGPSNAIEGYVPQRDRSSKLLHSNNRKEGPKLNQSFQFKGEDLLTNEMDFISTIITGDEMNIPKGTSSQSQIVSNSKLQKAKPKASQKDGGNRFTKLEAPPASNRRESEPSKGRILSDYQSALADSSTPNHCDSFVVTTDREQELCEVVQMGETTRKSSLKSSRAKNMIRSVTWADEEKVDNVHMGNLCEFRETEGLKEGDECLVTAEDDDSLQRFASAEVCAIALSQAAEAVASGESDITDAVSEAGIIILPPSHDSCKEQSQEDIHVVESEPAPLKWPQKPGLSHSNFFNSEDSWYDNPPEGFILTLSTFATMWMALFQWITSSSLAYIYGRDESCHEEFSWVNGKEYPQKIVLSDGRSSEIKQTLARCLARALPGLVSELRLPTPISTLERSLGCLLDTMSFIDALPPLRMKQWQVIVFLFVEALSVCRLPALTPHLTSRTMLLHKVVDGSQISVEEYEVMKDLIIPLGRLLQFSAQSGG